MSFREIQFPANLSRRITGGPQFATDIVVTGGGHEKRNARWSHPLRKYDAASAIQDEDDAADFIEFLHAVGFGSAYGFRLKDWTDYQATTQEIGTGDGAETEFQLVKVYTFGAQTYTRTITKPVSGSVTIFLDDVEKTSGVTVDTTTGVVTLSPAPSNGVVVTATFQFDVPVRFEADLVMGSLDPGSLFGWDSIPMIEIRI